MCKKSSQVKQKWKIDLPKPSKGHAKKSYPQNSLDLNIHSRHLFSDKVK